MPYKIDVQQGNYLSQEAVAQLKPGMSRSEARALLGSPLLSDAFHPDRWDYVYLHRKGMSIVEQRRLALHFEGDQLKRIEGDLVPSPGLAKESVNEGTK